MSTPWGGEPGRDPFAAPGPPPYGAEIQPYGSGPVDPYAGQAGPPVPTYHPYAGQAGPPAPTYNPYVNPGSWEPAQYLPRQSVPGTIIAGSIVGYLFALFLFVTGLLLVFFGSVVPDAFDDLDSTLGDGGTSLVVAGLGNWIAVGLLVAGGVLVSLRRPAGLIVSLAASGLIVVLAVYWVVLYPVGGIVFWAFVHVVIGLLPAALIALAPANRAWLARAPGSGLPPRPSGPPPFPTDQYGRPFGS